MPANVLCITDYFLPGFRGGGPIRTLDNMRKQLIGQVNLSIFTRDRDLDSNIQYSDIDTNRWADTPDGPIYYATPDAFGTCGVQQALAAHDFDVVYLNSFFSFHASISIYLSLRRLVPRQRILLAPRGEFSSGALVIKRHRKRIFLMLIRPLGLYSDIFWHASTQKEAEDILRLFPNAADRIFVASDPVLLTSQEVGPLSSEKKAGRLRIAFISRISPMKNLDGLIGTLASVPVSVELDIFGPIEDHAYWSLCEDMICTLPDNIQVRSHGPILPDEVSRTFSQYDIFAFPTHGENFGHIIFEALRAGTPVLVSDQTPWQPDEIGALTVIPLKEASGWRNAILSAANRTCEDQQRVRDAALAYAKSYITETGSLSFKENLEMFRKMCIPKS